MGRQKHGTKCQAKHEAPRVLPKEKGDICKLFHALHTALQVEAFLERQSFGLVLFLHFFSNDPKQVHEAKGEVRTHCKIGAAVPWLDFKSDK